MKTATYAAAAALVLAAASAAPSSAQDNATAQPLELYACTFKEGKGFADLESANKGLKKWAAKHSRGYNAWMITPQFRTGEMPFEVGFIGAYDNAEQFGAQMQKWVHESGAVSQAYTDALDCSHALMASYTILEPDGEPGDGVVWFARCSLDDDSGMADAMAGHSSVSAMMVEMEAPGASWILAPSLGVGDVEFDYYHVAAWPSYAALGKAFEAYMNGGGITRANATMDDVAHCSSPNLYDAVNIIAAP